MRSGRCRRKRPPDALRTPARYGLAAAVAVFAADQAAKLWVLAAQAGLPVEVLPFFNIVLVWNRGVSFGMFGAAGPLVLAAIGAAVAAVLVVWMLRAPRRFEALALGAVAGGAAGNILDRLTRGAVVDFLDFHIAGWHWYAFNLADSAITIGVAMLLFDAAFLRGRRTGETGGGKERTR